MPILDFVLKPAVDAAVRRSIKAACPGWPLDFANDSFPLETDYGKRLTMSAEPKPTQLPSKDEVTGRAGQ